MITASKYCIEPTRFPDGTSQVWKLPDELINGYEVKVEWLFEEEREIIDLLSLRRLLYSHPISLSIPYLPYGRQDKKVRNDRTFNLEVFADLLNSMRFSSVTAFDAHNPKASKRLIKEFKNEMPINYHRLILSRVKPDLLVFPDEGALDRYPLLRTSVGEFVAFEKTRDQLTGDLKIHLPHWMECKVVLKKTALIVDDICDGGGTFILVAKALKRLNPGIDLHLAVSHGLFTKGRQPLLDAGLTLHSRYSWDEPLSKR